MLFDFARRYFDEGKTEGRAEGRIDGRVQLMLKLLSVRFGPLPDAILNFFRAAQEEHIDALAERMLTAKTLDEALGPLPKDGGVSAIVGVLS